TCAEADQQLDHRGMRVGLHRIEDAGGGDRCRERLVASLHDVEVENEERAAGRVGIEHSAETRIDHGPASSLDREKYRPPGQPDARAILREASTPRLSAEDDYSLSVFSQCIVIGVSVSSTMLGLLEPQPSHGYELKREYDRRFGRDRPLPFGQVYATLARLER